MNTIPRLSPRQLEVLSYMLTGKTNIEIAACLGNAPLTIKNQVQRICTKLSANNRQHAVYRAMCLGIIQPPTPARPEPPKPSNPPQPVHVEPIDDWIYLGNIELSVSAHAVKVAGRPMTVSTQVFELLRLLMRSGQRILPYEHLIGAIWTEPGEGNKANLSVHAVRLRQALEHAGASHHVATERGIGYRLEAVAERQEECTA